MQLMPSIGQRQKQSLVMTPQLQQAIKLLQMTNLDIKNYLENQVLENPFLEVHSQETLLQSLPSSQNSPTSDTPPENQPKNQPEIQPEIQPVDSTSAAVSNDPTEHADFDNRYSSSSLDLGNSQPKNHVADSNWDDIMSNVAGQPDNLNTHILRQIDLNIKDTREKFIACMLADAIEASGWLGQSCSEIASHCNCEVEQIEIVLTKLQTFEPAGIFARTLSECLTLQAKEQGSYDTIMATILENLELLGKGELAILARKAHAEIADIAKRLQIIRSFNPKPTASFEAEYLAVNAPDIIVRESSDGLVVDLNRSTLPSLVINEAYVNEINKGARNRQDEEIKSFTSDSVGSARWLKRSLEQRNNTTLKIAGEIVNQQSDFFKEGLSGLKPLSLKDVATAVNMHESTVSRVTSGLLMATPKGCFTLKSFFSVSIAATESGDGTAAAAVRDLIKTIISNELPKKPLSDDAIAALVSEKGIKLARRTVAKYREMMRIPSSSERRRQAKLNMAI
jgi:RNA polymerase sigma-54 factor